MQQYIFYVVLAIILIYVISTFNYFKKQYESILQEKSGIDVALTSRYDTLVKMRDAVKGYVKHENTTFVEVTKVRKGMSVEELSETESQIQNAIGEINALAESYPELKASINFVELQRAITSSEDNLQAARRAYNATVSQYNSKVASIPSCFIAPLANAKRMSFFEADTQKSADVKMDF